MPDLLRETWILCLHTHTHTHTHTHFITKKLFANNISNKGFIHKLHKRHIQLNIQKKKKKQIKMGRGSE